MEEHKENWEIFFSDRPEAKSLANTPLVIYLDHISSYKCDRLLSGIDFSGDVGLSAIL